MRPKDRELYKKNMVGATGFDFDLLFSYLESGRENAERIEFFKNYMKEMEEFEKKDLVVDIRETWGEMFARIRDFEDPKLIPREELPEEFQPHRSFYGKFYNWANGIDPYPPSVRTKQKSKPPTDVEMQDP
jgi:hypothetical protein